MNQEELDEKHPRNCSCELPDGRLFAIIKPSAHEMQRFLDAVNDDKKSKTVTLRDLVLSCTVEPSSPKDARAALDEYPSLISKFALAAQELAGSELTLRVKA